MAELKISTKKINYNIKKLNLYFGKRDIQWTLVTKILCGNKEVLKEILSDDSIKNIHSIGDSRMSSLKTIKNHDKSIVTMYIKPPAQDIIKSIVAYADISLNTSLKTILALNEEAKRQNKMHRVVIMIELGELREGVIRENIVGFYRKIFELPNIIIEGIGSNLGCMYGVEPTYDKLIQLSLYKQLLESIFNKDLKIISGGSSITLQLIKQKKMPSTVNHMRIGEAVFCGTSPFDNKRFSNLNIDAFQYFGNIVELEEKEVVPDGSIGDGNVGHSVDYSEDTIHSTTHKAIVDFGILDVDAATLNPKDSSIQFVGTTSDLTVYDLGDNKNKTGKPKYRVGDRIAFLPGYMGVARLMNSKFINKVLQ
jgi:predicted amino acid racemase